MEEPRYNFNLVFLRKGQKQMKILAKIRIGNKNQGGELIQAFFEEFNPKSKINIKGVTGELEIFFDGEPPLRLIEAIGACDGFDLLYGEEIEKENDKPEKSKPKAGTRRKKIKPEEKASNQTETVEKKKEIPSQAESAKKKEEVPNQTEIVEKQNEIPEQTELAEKQEISGRTKKAKRKKDAAEQVEKKNVAEGADARSEITNQLRELAEKATSFESFVKLVGNWMNTGRRQSLFEELIKATSMVTNICWGELANACVSNGVIFKDWEKFDLAKKFKMKTGSKKFLIFLEMVANYKDYPFRGETELAIHESEGESQVLVPEENQEEVSKENSQTENVPEMSYLAGMLGSVIKTQSKEEKLRYILTVMGLEKENPDVQKEIFDIAYSAVMQEKKTLEEILADTKIPEESWMKARMNFAKFINDFVSAKGSTEKIKLLDFLKDLKEIVQKEDNEETPNE